MTDELDNELFSTSPGSAGRAPSAEGGREEPDESQVAAQRVFDLAREGRTAELSSLIDAGLPADATNDSGDTLLLLAAHHDHPDTVAALLAHGADPDRANEHGHTALAAAVLNQSVTSVEALLAAGADPQAGAPSAQAVARQSENAEMVALFKGTSA